MSELAKFVKKVEEVSKKWTVLSQGMEKELPVSVWTAKYISEHEKLEKEVLEELQPTAEKLAIKLNQVDPVTGERRYGLQSVQKFSAAHDSLNKLATDISARLEPLKKQHEEYLAQNTESTMDVVDTSAIEEEERRKKEEDEKLRLAQEQAEAAEEARKRAEEEAFLHEQAEKIRKRKHQEQEQCKEVENKVYSLLIMINCFLLTFPFRLSQY
jgi:hypothetical protein